MTRAAPIHMRRRGAISAQQVEDFDPNAPPPPPPPPVVKALGGVFYHLTNIGLVVEPVPSIGSFTQFVNISYDLQSNPDGMAAYQYVNVIDPI